MRTTALFLGLALLIAFSYDSVGNSSVDDPRKTSAMKLGRMKAMSCAGCHGMTGEGVERDGKWVAPGYADSEILKGSAEALAAIILKGVKGSENYTGAMGPMEKVYDDRSLAAVMTYVRNKWADHDDLITADQAAAWREKYGSRSEPMTRDELKSLLPAE